MLVSFKKYICLYDRRRAPMLKPQITPINIPYEEEAMDAHHNRGGDLAVQRLQNLPQSLYAPLGCVGEHAAVWTDLGWLKPCSLHLHSPDGEAQQLCWHLPQSERHTITQCTRTGIMRTHSLWINRSVVLKKSDMKNTWWWWWCLTCWWAGCRRNRSPRVGP